jgi:hypothetical protein
MMSTSETSRSQLVPRDFSEKELNQFLDNAVLKHRDDDSKKKRSRLDSSSSPKNQ